MLVMTFESIRAY